MAARNKPGKLALRIYITKNAPSSVRALDNLRFICKEYLDDNYELEVVDTLQDPLRAMQDGIIVTPTLVKVSPAPQWSIVGDLSEETRVLSSIYANEGDSPGSTKSRR